MQISGSKNNLSNIIVAYTGRDGIKINSTSSNNNIIHNFLSYNNGGAGVWMDGSNNSISRGYIFNNGGKAVDGGGNSNFYFNNLTMFRNVGGNTATPLGRGLGSFWRSTNPFNNGTIVTTGAFSNDWIVRPTNVPGFNPATRGYQDRLSWSGSINWAFGSRVPLQVTPIIPSECTLSVTSTTPCQLQLGGIGDYSANKKIAQP